MLTVWQYYNQNIRELNLIPCRARSAHTIYAFANKRMVINSYHVDFEVVYGRRTLIDIDIDI